jgi:arsenite-transporting ATPase
VPIAGYVVNRVLPSNLTGQAIPPYLQNRLKMQGRYLEEIDQHFGRQVIARVPELERDVTGLPMIEKLAGLMYANGGK